MRYVIFFFLLFPLAGQAQHSFFSTEINYGTYDMTGMKDFQSDYIQYSGYPVRPVTTFPSYYGYGLTYGLQFNRIAFGWSINYNSTAGRSDYEDYSGMARLDQQLRSYAFRSFFKYQVNRSTVWPFYISISSALVKTNLDINQQFGLGGIIQSNQASYYSYNDAIQPSFVLQRNFATKLFFQWSIGYEYQLTGKLYRTDNNSIYLRNHWGNSVDADWSGPRLGMGIGVYPWKKPMKVVK